MSLTESFVAYLKAYAAKDLQRVSGMLAEGVLLRDWNISVSGRDSAVAETEKNFQSADAIEIEILRTFESDDAVAGELKITVDETEVLHVVDVVSFNGAGKIQSIRAYLGRED